MVNEVIEFLGLAGLVANPPTNLAELIPYMTQLAVSVVLASLVFRLIGVLLSSLFNRGRW